MLTSPINRVGSGTDSGSFESNSQRGFTLVELMIAMTIGLVMLLAVGTVFTSSHQVSRVQEDNARIQESGRFALEIIGRNIKQAGHTEIPFTGFKVGFAGAAITGTDGTLGDPNAADTLIVQYDGAAGDRDCEGSAVTAASAVAAAGIIQNYFNLDAPNAQLQCQGSIGASPAAPASAVAGQPLLENIEDFQVLYGIDTTGDQSVDQYVPLPANLNQVITARVCVLIRSNQINIVPAGGTYLDCNGAAVAVPADRRLRRAFTGTFNLRNRVNNLP